MGHQALHVRMGIKHYSSLSFYCDSLWQYSDAAFRRGRGEEAKREAGAKVLILMANFDNLKI